MKKISLFVLLFALCASGAPIRSMIGANGSELVSDGSSATAADYIQDGLICIWDGIENAGWGVHSDNPSDWADLVSGYDATPVGSPEFGDSFVVTRTGSYFSLQTSIGSEVIRDNITCEIVFKPNEGSTESNQGLIGIGTTNSRLLWCWFGARPMDVSCSLVWCHRQFVSSGICRVWNDQGPFLSGINSTSFVVAEGIGNCFLNGIGVYITRDVPSGQRKVLGTSYIGRIPGLSAFDGKIYCIRIYNRALEDDEIFTNYLVDRERFGRR